MSFQIKDFASIAAGTLNHVRAVTDKITDLQPGSVARTLLESPAIEIEQLYIQMFLGLRDAIPVATFLSFGFDKLAAAVAQGYVSVSANTAPTSDVLIQAGTRFFATDGRVYTSTQDVTLAAGQTLVHVPVAYGSAGAAGNAPVGAITTAGSLGTGYTISNSAITTGRDAETDTERAGRFAEYIASLSRGTVVACLYAAKSAVVLDASGNRYEYVTKAGISEISGRVKIYLYSSIGVPSAALLDNAQKLLDGTRDDAAGTITPGYRPAGVRVEALPMVERLIPLTIRVAMQDGYTLSNAVVQKLDDVFGSSIRAIGPGQTLYLDTLVEYLLAIPSVQKIVPSSNENIVCGVDEALQPGALTVLAL